MVGRWLPAALAAFLLVWLAVVACEPSLNETTFEVASPRILAVRADAVGDGGAETDYAEPDAGSEVTLTALYVGPDGPIDGGPFDWAFCIARNPLANLGPVDPSCAQASGPATVFQELNGGNASAASVTAPAPANACSNFGPNVPPIITQPDAGDAGQTPGRPVDPDSTGGYYQPVRLLAGNQIALDFVRINCGTVGATPAELGALSTLATVANTNPKIDSVSLVGVDGGTPLFEQGRGTNPPVAVAQQLDLQANWEKCPADAAPCTGSQTYALLNPVTSVLEHVNEQMRVSWFSTAGTFANDTTAPDAGGADVVVSNAENTWTAPTTPPQKPVYMWVVLRDDRGGVGWKAYVFDVK